MPRAITVKTYLLCLFGVLLFFISFPKGIAVAETVVVGIYANKPVVFSDANGEAKGIYVDLLSDIADKEGWDVRYLSFPWAECLNRLEQGKIDLLTAIGFSEERSARYDFTQTTVLTNWGQIYSQKGTTILSALDLNGRNIGFGGLTGLTS
jgi:ABC-type amino acid transport substrate-binding protein